MNAQRRPVNQTSANKRSLRGRLTAAIVCAALAAYMLSGFFFVQPNERGVVRWFGRVPNSQMRPPFGVNPGLHYALPRPFCRVARPRTTEVRQVTVGLRPEQREAIERGETWAMRASPASDIFTGDVNILKVTMIVHFQVLDSVAYTLAVENPDDLVRLAVKSVLIEELAKLPVDQALTAVKAKLEFDTRQRAQQLLDDVYHCGVLLADVNLESIEPPRAIAPAFKDVVSAKKDGEREVDRAVTEANRILPQARGDAARFHEEAQAYYQERVKRAHGGADSFLNMLKEYRLAPRVTADRLRLQTFEKVFANIRKIIADNDGPAARVRIVDDAPE